ncbi:MAG TPA: HAMP domain-containing sensor histidine kinase [Gemmatimonadaceae bacterium]|jgi:signal transduction histidine kinase|nr:HAMP domain-containing sensor histidine kinase [Gemmatimonadaceae bacterium]
MTTRLQPPLRRPCVTACEPVVAAPPAIRNASLAELLAAIAHELRNPLTMLRGEAAVLRRRSAQAHAVVEGTAIIDRQVTQIASFLQDLVGLAEEQDHPLPPRTCIDVAELLDRAVDSLGRIFDLRLVRISTCAPTEPITVEGDVEGLTRALVNMLAALASAAALGGGITLDAWTQDDTVILQVASYGVRMSAELMSTAFDPFVRQRHGIRASGVSLAAARRTIEAHDGGVVVRARPEGNGTEFLVRLPRLVIVPHDA